MKILFVSHEPRYESIVTEIKKKHEVDYVFMGERFTVKNGRFQIPRLFNLRKSFQLLSCVFVSYLLLTQKYDVCITDYKSVRLTTFFPLLKSIFNIGNISYVYDIRTIPVNYLAEDRDKEIDHFRKSITYANKYYQGLTVITETLHDYIEEKYTKLDKSVGVWESGVDIDKFRPTEINITLKRGLGFNDDDFVCFYHGSLGYKRGVLELVKAFHFLSNHEQNIKLLIVGSGATLPKIEQTIKKYNMEKMVKIVGWVNKEEMPSYIAVSDLCIIPLCNIDWWNVSSPLKLMEYLSCGKNILLTDIVAHQNVVGQSGNLFWIKSTNPNDIANSIEEAFRLFKDDPVSYQKRGEAEREKHLASISYESRANSLISYLKSIMV